MISRLQAIYAAQLTIQLKRFLHYRISLIFWIMSMMLSPVIFISVWSAVGGTSAIDGFTKGDFAAYYIILLFVNHITFAWTMMYWEFLIRKGYLSYLLLRPAHVFHEDVAENLIYKLVTLPFISLVAVVLVLTFSPTFHTQWWHILAFVPAILLAYILRFIFDLAAAMLAFWVPDNEGINAFYSFAVTFISGISAPLILFPVWFQVIANFLPFRWTIEFPVLLLMGHLNSQQVLSGMIIQCVWIVVGIGLLSVLWRYGLKRFSGVGI